MRQTCLAILDTEDEVEENMLDSAALCALLKTAIGGGSSVGGMRNYTINLRVNYYDTNQKGVLTCCSLY